MNERIRELSLQSMTIVMNGSDPDGDIDKMYIPSEFINKFAQLIILACADIAYKTSWDDLVHGYGQAVIPLHLHNTIKQHFGVEE